ncbi:MAG TPA: glucose-6-phosphate isomerase family protein [Pedobacter sp.]|jgi:glucose-6-phosphate isomerase
MIASASVQFLINELEGENIIHKTTYIKDLKGLYLDEVTRAGMPQDTQLYEVDAYFPVPEGTEGGLFFGITRIKPGKIGDEYIFTKGHFHAKSDRGEYYWGIEGEGILLLMDRERNCRAEMVKPGSLHYIPAHTAHRVANTGDATLSFGASWPSDAGHDYEEIFKNGFSARVIEVDGEPQLISV